MGFKVWDTDFGRIGVGICWDQWFPETARSMAIMGADLLMYPTAIGSEPSNPLMILPGHWQRTMQGHAAANMVALAAVANCTGTEEVNGITMNWYGQSSLSRMVRERWWQNAACQEDSMAMAEFDFDAMRRERASWGLFRDRRPEHYQTLMRLS